MGGAGGPAGPWLAAALATASQVRARVALPVAAPVLVCVAWGTHARTHVPQAMRPHSVGEAVGRQQPYPVGTGTTNPVGLDGGGERGEQPVHASEKEHEAVAGRRPPSPSPATRRARTVATHLMAVLCGAALAAAAACHGSGASRAAPSVAATPCSQATTAPSAAAGEQGRGGSGRGGAGAMVRNRVLAGTHRVCVTQWTLIGAASANYSQRFVEPPSAARPLGGVNPLTDQLDSLFRWAQAKGYDGLEMSLDDFRSRRVAGVVRHWTLSS